MGFDSMRTLALDMGKKRVGLALSDELGLISSPLATLSWSGTEPFIRSLEELIRKYEIGRIVVGLPLHMSGREGDEAAAARRIGALISERLQVDVDYWDERLTTVEAESMLIEADLSRKKRKKKVDKLAACLILQGYLDWKAGR